MLKNYSILSCRRTVIVQELGDFAADEADDCDPLAGQTHIGDVLDREINRGYGDHHAQPPRERFYSVD